jgi:hypothetical protein
MAEETYGLDDELPEWADELHGVPADDVDDDGEGDVVSDEAGVVPPFDEDPFGDFAFDRPFGDSPTISEPSDRVGLLDKGVIKWYSQRPRPFTNCMFASLCTTLSYMGYDVPRSFIGALREASEVPPNKATSTGHTKKAMRKLLPDADLRFGGMSDDELRKRLGSREISVRVMVRNQDLPQELRQFTGSFEGGHAIALGPARGSAAGGKVHWLDPMGRPSSYDGVDVGYGRFEDALMRTPSGLVRVTYGRRNAALEGAEDPEPADDEPAEGMSPRDAVTPIVNAESATVLTRARLDEFVHIQRGTPFLHQRTQQEVTKAADTADFRVAGRSMDGRFYGVWVNTRRLRGAKGLTLLLVEQDRVGKPFPG